MLKAFIRRRIAAFERSFGYDMSYARQILDASLTAIRRFEPVTALATYRDGVPLAPWYAAKITAALGEDCGPCTQLVVTMAERQGVSPTVLRGILEGDERAMGEETALGWRFARAVLAHDPEADVLRDEVVRRWGEKGLVSLALTIAASRIYPTVKYALGHGKACVRVQVGGKDSTPLSPLAGRRQITA